MSDRAVTEQKINSIRGLQKIILKENLDQAWIDMSLAEKNVTEQIK